MISSLNRSREDFLCTAKDIDLFTELQKQDLTIIIFPKVKIIHYKGERQKKAA